MIFLIIISHNYFEIKYWYAIYQCIFKIKVFESVTHKFGSVTHKFGLKINLISISSKEVNCIKQCLFKCKNEHLSKEFLH